MSGNDRALVKWSQVQLFMQRHRPREHQGVDRHGRGALLVRAYNLATGHVEETLKLARFVPSVAGPVTVLYSDGRTAVAHNVKEATELVPDDFTVITI